MKYVQYTDGTFLTVMRRASIYANISLPIIALVVSIGIGVFAILADIARNQDNSYALNSQTLVENSLDAHAISTYGAAYGLGVNTSAYKHVTLDFSRAWLDDAYKSQISSGIAVHRKDKGVIFLSTRTLHAKYKREIEAAILQTARSHFSRVNYDPNFPVSGSSEESYLSVNGELAVISLQRIEPASDSGLDFPDPALPIDHVAVLTIISADKIDAMMKASGIEALSYVAGTNPPDTSADKISLVIKNSAGEQLGWFEWPRLRPGSEAFSERFWPISLGFLMVMIATIIVVRRTVARQMQALRSAKTAADDANKTKSTFLASVSHELRTPLNTIIGYAQIIEEDSEEIGHDQIRKDASKVTSSARHLLGLINDLLDHSKIEAGKMELCPERTSLMPIFASVSEAGQHLVEANSCALTVKIDDDIGDAFVDGMRLKQCLLNLISNAAKFTHNGSVLLAVRSVVHNNAPHLRITVKDTGIGMSKETLEKLFSPFVQADNSTAKNYGGTGLGLVITSALVNAMKGSLQVESEVGIGSTFTMIIPRGLDLAAAPEASEPELGLAA